MSGFQHKPCSYASGTLHIAFSDPPSRQVHNLCMPTKRKKDDPIAAEMARRLIQCRKARAWTQARLAEETGWTVEDAENGKARGLSPSRIGNYEQGTRRFSNEEAEIFGDAFGLPAAYFLVVLDEHEADVIIAFRKGREPSPEPARRRR